MLIFKFRKNRSETALTVSLNSSHGQQSLLPLAENELPLHLKYLFLEWAILIERSFFNNGSNYLREIVFGDVVEPVSEAAIHNLEVLLSNYLDQCINID